MIKGLKGALITMISMVSITILAGLHDANIINLNPWVSLPLLLLSFIVTLLGIMYMFGEFAKKGVDDHE